MLCWTSLDHKGLEPSRFGTLQYVLLRSC
ncbi:hypothetical protein M6B38_124285 [Iris pallida]|uniref:Uncharacterized protein n=1 Tax=Iris pallida TaxID=29817 RepID=A0AAX6H317_IRIPA|nr:hypothetical protein M6B38_124285 [Iris pallida]